jgi:hypothetical protein
MPTQGSSHHISGGRTAAHGPLLLGRYLCDDSLSLDEEVQLVRHLYSRYQNHGDALRQVAACMVTSGFLERRTLVLERLATTQIEDVFRDVETSVATVIESAIGPSPRLKAALAPASVPKFGQRAKRYV